MFLSIIIPVHNTEKYINDCLDSCLAQDINRNDYEIICVDDCSTDNSFNILKEYEQKFPNIRVFKLDVNSGVSVARNIGIESMKGDFCWFLDADDFVADNCLNEIKQTMISGCNFLTVGRYSFKDEGKNRIESQSIGEYLGISPYWYITSRIIARDLIGEIRFQANIAYGEDEVFFFELKKKNPIVQEIDKPIYFYRLHEQSAMYLNTEKSKKRIDSLINAATYLLNKYAPYDDSTIRFIRQRVDAAFSSIVKLPFKDRVKKLRLMKKKGLMSRRIKKGIILGRRRAYLKLRLSIWKTRIRKVVYYNRRKIKNDNSKKNGVF